MSKHHHHDGCAEAKCTDKHHHNHQHKHEQKQMHAGTGFRSYSKEQHETFMKRAIDLSEKASLIEKSGGVFGAVIVKDGKIIAEGYNQVVKHNDPTWHAEMQAIKEACAKLGTPHLDGCTLYTSAECCPMCLCAAMWAHVDHIYYGATIQDSLKYGEFDDVDFLAEIRKDPKERKLQFTELSRPAAVEIWKRYHDMPGRVHY